MRQIELVTLNMRELDRLKVVQAIVENGTEARVGRRVLGLETISQKNPNNRPRLLTKSFRRSSRPTAVNIQFHRPSPEPAVDYCGRQIRMQVDASGFVRWPSVIFGLSIPARLQNRRDCFPFVRQTHMINTVQ